MKRLLLAASAVITTLYASGAVAETVAVKDGKVDVDVSSTQMTRFTVRGDKILSAKTMSDPEGPNVLIQNDADNGDVYVGFDGEVTGRTFAVYLTTASGETELVLLHPDTSPAKNVELIGEGRKLSANGQVNKNNGYAETLVAFQKILFEGEGGEGVTCQDTNSVPKKTPNFLVYQVRYCSTDGLKGFVLQMQNTTTLPQSVKAEQFMLEHVVAAGVSNELVQPGESTRVYIEEEGAQ